MEPRSRTRGSIQGPDFLRALLILVLLPFPVAGYIDPLSGSIILQLVAAGVLAGMLSVKRFWARSMDLVRGLMSRVRGSD